MSADITTLGMAVDSTGVKRATDDLDGMTKAGEKAAVSATDVEKAMLKASIAGNVIGDAIGRSIVKVGELVKSFIELGIGVGRYQDIADQTQSDPAGLASMQVAADVAGVSINSVALAMNRMSMNIGKVTDESKGAGKALDAIGLSVEDIKKLKPDEQYKAIAVALNGYADGAGKVAVAQALFGRGGAEQLRVMKELADSANDGNIITAEQIALADALADNMARSQSRLRQTAEVISVQFLPAISGLTEATTAAISEFFGLDQATGKFKDNKAIQDFADGAVGALGFVVDAGDGVVRVFKGIGLFIGAAAAQAVALASGELSQAVSIGKELGKDMDALMNETLFSERLKTAIAKARSETGTGAPRDTRAQVDGSFAQTEARIKKEKDSYKEIVDFINGKIAAEASELEAGRKLTEAEKLRVDVTEKANKAKTALTSTQWDAVEAQLSEAEALIKANQQREAEVKWMRDSGAQNVQRIESMMRNVDLAEQLAESAKQELANYGLTGRELDRLEIKKLRDAAATLRQRKMVEDFNPDAEAYNRMLEQQAAALDKAAASSERLADIQEKQAKDSATGAQKAIDDYLTAIEEKGTETGRVVNSVVTQSEDALVEMATKGRADVRGLIDYVISEFWRLQVIRPLMKQMLGGGDGGGSIFNDLFSSVVGLFSGGMGINNTGTSLPTAGGRAGGGSVESNSMYKVNELGPELATIGGETFLMTGSKGGNVTPNSAIGGKSVNITIAPTIKIDSRSDAAQISQQVQAAIGMSQKAMMEELRAQGVM